MALEAGQQAPGFTLPDQDGRGVSLVAFRGRRVVIYFYPKDDTPGCTTEACQFNDSLAAFAGTGVDVIGVSSDGADSHQAFRARYGLQFPLLTDADHAVADAYGAWGERTRPDGSKVIGIRRSTFLVGPDGRLEHVWRDVTPEGHAVEVLAQLGAPA